MVYNTLDENFAHSAAVDIDKSNTDCHTEFTERANNNKVVSFIEKVFNGISIIINKIFFLKSEGRIQINIEMRFRWKC